MTDEEMAREEREAENVDLTVASALRIESLERQVAMIGAALNAISDHLADPELDAELEEVMTAASEEKKAEQEEQRQAA